MDTDKISSVNYRKKSFKKQIGYNAHKWSSSILRLTFGLWFGRFSSFFVLDFNLLLHLYFFSSWYFFRWRFFSLFGYFLCFRGSFCFGFGFRNCFISFWFWFWLRTWRSSFAFFWLLFLDSFFFHRFFSFYFSLCSLCFAFLFSLSLLFLLLFSFFIEFCLFC